MKEQINQFLKELILYDYILFGVSFFLFFLLIILVIIFRRKLFFALFLMLLSFSILALAPTLGYKYMHEYLYKNSVELLTQQKLNFIQAVVVRGVITNESKYDFKSCKITASAYKVGNNKFKNYIYPLNPFQKMSILEENILIGEKKDFKIIIEPFIYARDYNISLKAGCR